MEDPADVAVADEADASKAMLELYRMEMGDQVHLVETEGGILITPYDPTLAEAMLSYDEGTKQYRNAMRELAK